MLGFEPGLTVYFQLPGIHYRPRWPCGCFLPVSIVLRLQALFHHVSRMFQMTKYTKIVHFLRAGRTQAGPTSFRAAFWSYSASLLGADAFIPRVEVGEVGWENWGAAAASGCGPLFYLCWAPGEGDLHVFCLMTGALAISRAIPSVVQFKTDVLYLRSYSIP